MAEGSATVPWLSSGGSFTLTPSQTNMPEKGAFKEDSSL